MRELPVNSAEPRYGMLETVREFALQQLEASSEGAELRCRHAAHVLSFLERGDEGRRSEALRRWAHRLDAEEDNARAALAWDIRCGDAEAASRCLTAIRWFWRLRGRLREALQWMNAILSLPEATLRSAARARTLAIAGNFAPPSGNHALARAYLEESVSISRELGDLRQLASGLHRLGYLLRWDGSRALPLLRESAAIFSQLGDSWGEAGVLDDLGTMAVRQGDVEMARSLYEESLARSREVGDPGLAASPALHLAQLAAERGETAGVLAVLEEQVGYFREIGAVSDVATWLPHIIILRMRERRLDGVGSVLMEAMQFAVDAGISMALPGALEVAAGLAQQLHQHNQAARLYGAAEAAREGPGAPRPTAYAEFYRASVASLQGRLDADAFAAAWAAGRSLTLDSAIAEAMQLARTVDASTRDRAAVPAAAGHRKSDEDSKPNFHTGMSQREAEVLSLLAAGKSNREIAEALVLSIRTVETHIARIYGKIGAANRAEAAAYAVRHHIAPE